jgi:hypothetical protein
MLSNSITVKNSATGISNTLTGGADQTYNLTRNGNSITGRDADGAVTYVNKDSFAAATSFPAKNPTKPDGLTNQSTKIRFYDVVTAGDGTLTSAFVEIRLSRPAAMAKADAKALVIKAQQFVTNNIEDIVDGNL